MNDKFFTQLDIKFLRGEGTFKNTNNTNFLSTEVK